MTNDVLDDLRNAPSCGSVFLGAAQHTLSIEGLQLTSFVDRKAEAVIQASAVPADATEAWIYGPALGDTVRELLKRDALQHLHVVVMSRRVTKASFGWEKPAWLADQRVRLHLAKDVLEAKGPFVVSPAEMRLADEDAIPLRDRVTVEVNRDITERQMQAQISVELEQFKENKWALDVDPRVLDLFTEKTTRRGVVIAAGPTLKDHYKWAHVASTGSIIVTGTTALKPLLAADLIPNYVVVIDPSPVMMAHLDGVDMDRLKHTTLVYVPSVFPDILKAWKGPRYKAQAMYGAEGNDLFSGGSVVHSCTDLAVRLGCPEVYLIGADFCYPGDSTHVEGSEQAKPVQNATWMPSTVNGLGQRVPTREGLLAFRVALEEYVALHPETKFYKLGRSGVPVAGMEWCNE